MCVGIFMHCFLTVPFVVWIKAAPKPTTLASLWTANGFSKSEKTKTDTKHSFDFCWSRAIWHLIAHVNGFPSLVSAMRVSTTVA